MHSISLKITASAHEVDAEGQPCACCEDPCWLKATALFLQVENSPQLHLVEGMVFCQSCEDELHENLRG